MKQERRSQQNRQVRGSGRGGMWHGSGIAINAQEQAGAQQPRHHALQRHRRHKLFAFALNVELKSEQNEVVLRDRKA